MLSMVASIWWAVAIYLSLILPITVALPDLGVQWNPTAKANSWYNFGSRVVYDPKENTKDQVDGLTDGMLVGLARQAYNEMVGLSDYNSITRTRPAVVAALAVDNEVFLASSISAGFSGAQSFLYDWGGDPDTADHIPEVTHLLESCQVQLVEAGGGQSYKERHSVGGRCAEPMAIHQYLRAHPGSNFQGKGARIAAWGRQRGLGTPVFLNACGKGGLPNHWGCHQLVRSLDIRIISQSPEEAIADYTVSPQSTLQVAMCSPR